VGLNVVGLKRRGHSRADLHRVRRCYRALFFGAGAFRDRFTAVAAEFSADPLTGRIVEFLRDGGSRPPMMPAQERGGDRAESSAMHE
jgi:UDP-N-acetylglucosamine acyltransferase